MRWMSGGVSCVETDEGVEWGIWMRDLELELELDEGGGECDGEQPCHQGVDGEIVMDSE
jgi:hypothetical protein